MPEGQDELRETVEALFGFKHSPHCPATEDETGIQIKCAPCRLTEALAEIDKQRLIIEWYEEKHRQRRAQLYAAEDRATDWQNVANARSVEIIRQMGELDELRKELALVLGAVRDLMADPSWVVLHNHGWATLKAWAEKKP